MSITKLNTTKLNTRISSKNMLPQKVKDKLWTNIGNMGNTRASVAQLLTHWVVESMPDIAAIPSKSTRYIERGV